MMVFFLFFFSSPGLSEWDADLFVHLQNKAMFCPFMKQSKTQESGCQTKMTVPCFFCLNIYSSGVCDGLKLFLP